MAINCKSLGFFCRVYLFVILSPSNSQPSTPSTDTPVDGVAIAGNMQHVNNMPKGPMMYGSDGISGLASSANQLVCLLISSDECY